MKSKISRIFLSLGLFFLVLLQGIPALAVPTVTLDVLDTEIWPGEQFRIDVVANGVTDIDPDLGTIDELLAFGFDIDYDLSWSWDEDDTIIGSDFSDDSSSFPYTDIAGSVVFPGPGPSGDNIILASLFFTPSTAGAFNFGIFSDPNDSNEGLITWLYYSPDEINFEPTIQVHVVPEPSTLLLLGPGLCALVRLRKRA